MKDIILIFGGESVEYDISCASKDALKQKLLENGYNVKCIDITFNPVESILNEYKLNKDGVVFNVCHGGIGENGTIQAILDTINIKYVGPGMVASVLSSNKLITKNMLAKENVLYPMGRSINVNSVDDIKAAIDTVDLPCVVKHANLGSSHMTFLIDQHEAIDLIKDIIPGMYLIEEYIPGQEISVCMIDKDCLGIALISPPENSFFDVVQKYNNNLATTKIEIIHIDHPKIEKYNNVICESVKIVNALELTGLVRLDFIEHAQLMYPYFLEVNSQPGMSTRSISYRCIESGIGFNKFFRKIFEGL